MFYTISLCHAPLQASQIKRIFGTMINQKLQDFDEDVKPLGDIMTQATIEIYNYISSRMLPTPTKIHYLFNLRDISKVRWCRHKSVLLLFFFYGLFTLAAVTRKLADLQRDGKM